MTAHSVRDEIADAIDQADRSFGFEIKLIRLVDGESTYRLTMSEGVSEHGSYDDAAELMGKRRAAARADAILAAIGDGLVEPLRAALRPFAEHPDFHAPFGWPVTTIDPDGLPGVTAGDFRQARAAYIASFASKEGETS